MEKIIDMVFDNYSLKPHNSFGIDVKARFFAIIENQQELISILNNADYQNLPRLIIGEGNNVLFTSDYNGLVIKPNLKGIIKISEDSEKIRLSVGACENWDDFVSYCCKNNYNGIENLSLIPGTVGAAPIQNIGAYGTEVKNYIEKIEAFNIENNSIEIIDKKQCKFSYRNSIFKNEYKGKYIILHVYFLLQKKLSPNLGYGILNQKVHEFGEISLQNIRKAVIEIRNQKLPDPQEIGNAGSFFKNPQISKSSFENLFEKYPKIPFYKAPENKIKLAAGWLIEQCGWKGYRKNNVGVHTKQALVLVNYGGAKGNEILKLANEIQKSVKDKFEIDLIPEVNII